MCLRAHVANNVSFPIAISLKVLRVRICRGKRLVVFSSGGQSAELRDLLPGMSLLAVIMQRLGIVQERINSHSVFPFLPET
eukprot:15381831-Heterocapsa_arctica.AAC.1